MKLYHGSTIIVRKPNVKRGRVATDFGQGFYLTTSFEQAHRWALLKQRRENSKRALVSVFDFDETMLNNFSYSVLQYDGPTEDWLNFVVQNRKGESAHNYDYVMGPVANDQLYATISMYEKGTLSAEAAIVQLKSHVLFNQLSCHTAKATANLQFVESVEVDSNTFRPSTSIEQ